MKTKLVHDFRLYSGVPNTIKCMNCGKVLILKSDELELCHAEMSKEGADK